jgi:site-specific DNA recombinase
MRAAIYCRVSTAEQVNGTSMDVQRERCAGEVERRGWTVAGVFADGGVSGSKSSRPHLNEMLAATRRGEIDAIVVTKLDRFGRSLAHLAPTLAELDDLGVALVAIDQNIDSSTPSGRAMRGILGVFAEMEREIIAERGVSGQRAKAMQGRWPGGSPPYGYRLDGQGRDVKPIPDEDERRCVDLAVEAILDQGQTTGDAAVLLNGLGLRRRSGVEWTDQTVRRTLESEGLTGIVWWGKADRRHGGGHHTKTNRDGSPKWGEPVQIRLTDPPLTDERWKSLQRVLRDRGYGFKEESKIYPNSGAATACGGRLGGVYRKDRDLRQYRCSRSKWSAGSADRCDCSRVSADWLDSEVWREVTSVLSDPNRLLSLASDYLGLRQTDVRDEAAEAGEVARRIAGLERAKIDQVKAALKAGVPAEVLADAVQEIQNELDALLAFRNRLESVRQNAQAEQDRMVALAALAERAGHRLPFMELHEQREVLRILQVRVTLLDSSDTPRLQIEGVVPGGGTCSATRRAAHPHPGPHRRGASAPSAFR